MPIFEYKATTKEGELLTGQRESNDKSDVIMWLQDLGYIPIQAQEITASKRAFQDSFGLLSHNQLSTKEILEFTEQLSTLVRSKLPLDHALRILEQITESEKTKKVILNLHENIQSGSQFSVALEAENQFSPFYINIIRASEASGNIDNGLEQLHHYLDGVKQMKDKVLSALLYPMILLFVAGVSVLLILMFVVPKITELFVGSDQALPIATQVVITISNAVIDFWWILPLLIIFSVIYLKYLNADIKRKRIWHSLFLKIPLLKEIIIRIETAKFAKSLSTLISNGVNMQIALPIANATLTNLVFSQNIANAVESFKEGKSLFDILNKVKHFPTLASQMINVGEETGALENMLKRIAEIYDRETSIAMQRFLTLLEPIMIVTLGLMIGGIIISILMAIISVNDLPL